MASLLLASPLPPAPSLVAPWLGLGPASLPVHLWAGKQGSESSWWQLPGRPESQGGGKKEEAAFSVPETYLGLVDIKRYP